MLDYDSIYEKGIELYDKKPKEAKTYLEQCLESEKYRQKVIIRLVKLYLKENKLDKARKLITEIDKGNTRVKPAAKQVNTQLNMMEYNYDSCKNELYELFINNAYYEYATTNLAVLYTNLGDLMVARKMYETLMYKKNADESNLLQIVYIDIIRKDYEKAYKVLKTIDFKKIKFMEQGNYKVIKTFIENKLGIFNKKLDLNPVENYGSYIVLNDDKEAILKHINRHLSDGEKRDGCFFKYTDTKKLLSEAKERIEYMNPSHRRYSSIYRFKLDDPIGFTEDGLTNDLCVVTFLGTKRILTMYPIKLSDEFNKEGYLTKKLTIN